MATQKRIISSATRSRKTDRASLGLLNRALVDRWFQDRSIPCAKLDISCQGGANHWLGFVGNVVVVDPNGGGLNNTYVTLAAGLAAASSGDQVIYFDDHTLTGDITIPAGVTLNGTFGGNILAGARIITMNDGSRLVNSFIYSALEFAAGATCYIYGGQIGRLHFTTNETVYVDNVSVYGAAGFPALDIDSANSIFKIANSRITANSNTTPIQITTAINSSSWLSNCFVGPETPVGFPVVVSSTIATTLRANNCNFYGTIDSDVRIQGANNTINQSDQKPMPLIVVDNGDGSITESPYVGSVNSRPMPAWEVVDATTLAADTYLWFLSPVLDPRPTGTMKLIFSFGTAGAGNLSYEVEWAAIAGGENFDTAVLSGEGVVTFDVSLLVAANELASIETTLNATTLTAGDYIYGRIRIVDATYTVNNNVYLTNLQLIWE